VRWILEHRAWTPYYLRRYWRFLWFRLRHPDVVTHGFVFLGRRIEVSTRPGYGRLILGRWVHLGDGARLRAHEGTLRIDDKCVLGSNVTINCYLDIEIGASTLIADDVYVCDFDHVTTDITRPIKDQGIVKSPVRVGPDCWIGTKVAVLRGSFIGRGVVVGANAVVRGEIADYRVVGGVPARVLKDRRKAYDEDADRRAYLDGLARGAELDAEQARRLAAGGCDEPLVDGHTSERCEHETGGAVDGSADGTIGGAIDGDDRADR